MPLLRPNAHRARHISVLIRLILLFDLLALVSGAFQYQLLQSLETGQQVTADAAQANDLREHSISIVTLLLHVLAAVAFIRWFRRAYANLHRLDPDLTYNESEAGYAWFVPFLNLLRPYQIMKELYSRTREFLNNQNQVVQLSERWLLWWWGVWLTHRVLGWILLTAIGNAETLASLIQNTMASMLLSLLAVPLALLTLKVINDYAAAELQLDQRHTSNDRDTLDDSPIVLQE